MNDEYTKAVQAIVSLIPDEERRDRVLDVLDEVLHEIGEERFAETKRRLASGK